MQETVEIKRVIQKETGITGSLEIRKTQMDKVGNIEPIEKFHTVFVVVYDNPQEESVKCRHNQYVRDILVTEVKKDRLYKDNYGEVWEVI